MILWYLHVRFVKQASDLSGVIQNIRYHGDMGDSHVAWWIHFMRLLSAFLVLCEENLPYGRFSSQRAKNAVYRCLVVPQISTDETLLLLTSKNNSLNKACCCVHVSWQLVIIGSSSGLTLDPKPLPKLMLLMCNYYYTFGTLFYKIVFEIQTYSFKKMPWKMSSPTKWEVILFLVKLWFPLSLDI